MAVWNPVMVHEVEALIENIIELADSDALDILPSRQQEQDVLALLDEE